MKSITDNLLLAMLKFHNFVFMASFFRRFRSAFGFVIKTKLALRTKLAG